MEKEMVTVQACIDCRPESLRTDAIKAFAKEVGTTINTVYCWLRAGDMYVQFLDDPCKAIAVYRMIKFTEQ